MADDLASFAGALHPLPVDLGACLSDSPVFDDDSYAAKLDLLLHCLPPADRPPLVSFTFGLPSDGDVRAFQAAGIAAAGRIPVIAAGGTRGPQDIRRLLGCGALAVQLGTAFLFAQETGTRVSHREALRDSAGPTLVTRAFSGRAELLNL